MDPPPPYKESASMSRSRATPGSVRETADAMLRSSVSRNASSPTSTNAHSTPPISPPRSPRAAARLVRPTSSDTNDRAHATMDRRARLAATPYLPIMGTARAHTRQNSNTSEQLCLVEQERDELRRILESERAMVERLKKESGRASYVSNKEAKQRVSQLKDEARTATTAAPRAKTGLFKEACSTDLLFLIDSTSSMQLDIDAVKKQVKIIVSEITKSFFNEAEVRTSVVAYRDHANKPNIQWLDFTRSTDQVFKFLDKLTAVGGGDYPEDVLGGIQQAINASWQLGTRCIIHVADAPPHGLIFQDEPYRKDDYPTVGSEPHGLTYQPLLRKMAGLNINYILLPITKATERMAYLFSQVYAEASADVKLDKKNKYCNEVGASGTGQKRYHSGAASKRNAQGRLLFIEAEKGTVQSCLQRMVVKSVLSSAPRTATRASESDQRSRIGINPCDKPLPDINENESFLVDKDLDDLELETAEPQWDVADWFDETIPMDGFSPDVVVHGASTLDSMMQSDDKIKMSITEITIHKRSKPFAQGAMRTAAYARTAASNSPFVVKSFKRERKQLAYLAEDMRCQALCKAFALEFNTLVGEKNSIDFIVTTCLRGKSEMGSGDERLSLEPFIDGTYVKYNNNCGYVNEDAPHDQTNRAAQAFSHYTFERSRGRFLVSDLQGVGRLLTDPAIHTLDPARFQLSDTNLGEEGFKFFFATHECNDLCRSLGLRSNATMLLRGQLEFREKWPAVGSTVCCSNKFCGKIVRLETVKKALKYPGFYWCDGCWTQLESTMSTWVCVAPGPHHTFDVSSFFYESQGRLLPLTCPTHRVRDETVPRPPSAEGGNFWGRFKLARRLSR